MSDIHMPARENVDVAVYTHTDGSIYAFYGSNHLGWAPCISVWPIDLTDPKSENEDQMRINGMGFAYCTSDDTPEDFDDRLTLIEDPSEMRSRACEMMIAGILYERVKDC